MAWMRSIGLRHSATIAAASGDIARMTLITMTIRFDWFEVASYIYDAATWGAG